MRSIAIRAALLLGTASLLGLRASSGADPAPASTNPPSPPSTLASSSTAAPVPTVRPRVVASHPHDPDAFTQGLVVHGAELFESTGTYGQSTLRAVDPQTGKVRTRAFLGSQYFGEGTTVLGDKIYVLTWRERTCLVYSLDFLVVGRFTYEGEGWGLTNDGAQLIMSDGTTTLRFLDPATFQVTKTLHVREAGADVPKLNELEIVRGEIWANVWLTDRILRISPETGDVVGVLDLHDIDGGWSKTQPDAVLNGIAYDAPHDRIYVTGKLWPKLFEISVPKGR
jgi:glutaminyl-peptide cyclotransferase